MAMVDSGTSQTIVSRKLLPEPLPCTRANVAVCGGGVVPCPSLRVCMEIDTFRLSLDVLVMDEVVLGYEVLLGMDVIVG